MDVMEIPNSVWSHRLLNGVAVVDFVENSKPTVVAVTDATAFKNVWQQRLRDAQRLRMKEYEAKAKRILAFVAKHEQIEMLLWGRYKLAALFDPNSGHHLFVE